MNLYIVVANYAGENTTMLILDKNEENLDEFLSKHGYSKATANNDGYRIDGIISNVEMKDIEILDDWQNNIYPIMYTSWE